MSFQPASQVIPDVLGAMLLIRRRIRENSSMTSRMYSAICQVLEQIYCLPIRESEGGGPYFIVPNAGIYERMDNRLRRIERWVCQWPHREPINDAFDYLRDEYRNFLVYVANLQGEERHNSAQDYIDELIEFESDSEEEDTDTDTDRDADQGEDEDHQINQGPVGTPSYQERGRHHSSARHSERGRRTMD